MSLKSRRTVGCCVPAVTLPVEIYTPERVREFDAAEQKLAAWPGAKAPAVKRAARPKRKSAR